MRVTEVGWFDSQYEQTMPNTAAHLRIYAVFAIYASQIQSLCIFLCKHLSPFEFNTIGRLTSRRLAGLELVQVPATDSQTTLVLVHALAEALVIVCARTRLRHLSRRRVSGLVLGGEFSVLRRGFGGGRGTASKPAADCVADGRSYCDTAVQSALVKCICVVCGPKFFFAMFLRMTTSWQWGWRDMGS